MDSRKVPASTMIAILLCSLGVLMQEILLTRIFSFTIWYHLAYVTIGTALLGFGAAGSLVAAFPSLAGRDASRNAALFSAAAGIALLVSMWVLAPRPISPDRLLTQPAAFFVSLLGYYVAVTLPFLLAGVAIVIPLTANPERVSRLYAADLLGAGLGCAAAVLALTYVDGPWAVVLCAAVFFAAAACYAVERRLASVLAVCTLAIAGSAPFAHRVLDFVPTETKALSAATRAPGTRIVYTQWSPVNRVDLVEHRRRRGGLFWLTTGLSSRYSGRFPNAMSIQYDAHNGTSVFRPQGNLMAFLDAHVLRAPYVLTDAPRVLVIGVGGGIDVLNALRRGASSIVGAELQPITVALHAGRLRDWTLGAFDPPEVQLVAAEGRHFVRATEATYDLIQITAVDTFSAQSSGAYVLAESYLYTVEAFSDYFDRLSEDGILSFAIGDPVYRDVSIPGPLVTRLALIARRALELRGAEDARAHIAAVSHRQGSAMPNALVTGARMTELLVKRSPFTAEELRKLGAFARANDFEILLQPDVGDGSPEARLVGTPADALAAAIDAQAFALAPVTDDRPFFYHVVRWGDIVGGARTPWFFPGSTIGQLMLLIMLGQAVIVGGVLIFLPLARLPTGALPLRERLGFLAYFLALGLGFLLVEISFVQKYVLLLGYPTYSLSVTIFSLLVFAALGAALSRRWSGRAPTLLGVVLALTVALVVIETLALPELRERLLGTSLSIRVATTVLLQLPLGLCLGMYFPTGIAVLARREPRLVPWAWAVNGVGSVAASVLAVMLGMSIGFSGVAFVAAGVYIVGTLSLLAVIRGAPGSGTA